MLRHCRQWLAFLGYYFYQGIRLFLLCFSEKMNWTCSRHARKNSVKHWTEHLHCGVHWISIELYALGNPIRTYFACTIRIHIDWNCCKCSEEIQSDKMTTFERIAKGSAVIFIATVITAILEYAYQVSMAHFLSPSIFGILSVSLSIFWISAVILTSGVKISMAKFIAEDTNDERVASYLLNRTLFNLKRGEILV